MKFIKSKIFIFSLITVVMLVSIGLSSRVDGKINLFGNVITVPLSPLQKMISFFGEKTNYVVNFFKDIKETKEKNAELNIRVLQLEKERNTLLKYQKENERLKELLKFKDQFYYYEPVGAKIIAKDSGNWFNVFTVDVGMNDGIKVDLPVVSDYGLVGRIVNANLTSSKVIAIIDPDSTLSGRLVETRDLVKIKGDLILQEKGQCKMEYIPPDVDISVGDEVETSGLGGIYPEGILIGKVVQVLETTGNLNRTAIIQPSVDFKRLEEVLVFIDKSDSGTKEGLEK